MNTTSRSSGCEFCDRQQAAQRGAFPFQSRQAVAMAYVPVQTDTQMYEPCRALQQGTLFESLDKPFLRGCRA